MFDFGKMIRSFFGWRDDEEEKRREQQNHREPIQQHNDNPLSQPKQFQGFDATHLSTIQQPRQQEQQQNFSPEKPKTPMFNQTS